MNIEQLATVVMGEIGWINFWLIVITIICLVGFAVIAVKYKQLLDHVDGIEDILDDVRFKVEKL